MLLDRIPFYNNVRHLELTIIYYILICSLISNILITMGGHALQHMCTGQMITLWSWFSLSTFLCAPRI